MKLHNIATIRTKDNTFMEFIIGALVTSEKYHYHLTISGPPKEYVIDIFEVDPNSPYKKKEAKLVHIDIDPEVIRTSLTELEDSVAIQEGEPEDNNYIDLIYDSVYRSEEPHLFVTCPTCGQLYRISYNFVSYSDDDKEGEITFSCHMCGGEIHVKRGR